MYRDSDLHTKQSTCRQELARMSEMKGKVAGSIASVSAVKDSSSARDQRSNL